MWVYDKDTGTVVVMCAQSPNHRSVVAALPDAARDSPDAAALYTQAEFVATFLPEQVQASKPTVLVTCITGEDELTHTEQQVGAGDAGVTLPDVTVPPPRTTRSVLRLSTRRTRPASPRGVT